MDNIRFGNEARGEAPWRRQELIKMSTDENGFSTWEYKTVEMGCDYEQIWRNGTIEWAANNGASSRIIDASGKTVFIFD